MGGKAPWLAPHDTWLQSPPAHFLSGGQAELPEVVPVGGGPLPCSFAPMLKRHLLVPSAALAGSLVEPECCCISADASLTLWQAWASAGERDGPISVPGALEGFSLP